MRRWRRIFDPFNNLPLAVKLGLTTLGAMGLLAAVAWIGLDALARQQALDVRVAAAQSAERAGRRAFAAVAEMRLAAQEMQTAHLAEGVAGGARHADMMAGRVARLLDEMKAGVTDPAVLDVMDRAAATLADYQAKLAHEAELRQAAIDAYEQFVPMRGAVETAAGALRDLLGHEPLPAELAAPAQGDLAGLLAGAGATEAAVLTLRLGGGSGAAAVEAARADIAGARDALAAGVAQMAQHGAALGGLPVTPATADATRALVAAGEALGAGAQAALNTAAKAALFELGEGQQANHALSGRVDGAISPFVDAAQAARDAAAEGYELARWRLRALSAGAVALLLVLGAVFIATITRPVRAMTRAMQGIAAGDAARPVGFAGRRDEVGRMAAALETLRGSVARAFVQGEMIAQLPIGVMTAEPAAPFRITYANAAMRALLDGVAEGLPARPAEILGQSLGIFHAEPGWAETMLGDPGRLPARDTIALGDATLELTVSALRTAEGGYSGPMLCWRDRSGQERLSRRFERSVVGIAAEVGRSAGTMAGTAEAMSGAALGSGAQLERVADASRGATGHVQAVASSAEQLAASVREIAQQVAESARIAGGAVEEAEATDRTMGGLADAAARIGDVVRLIRDIAGRTNLLALNATIEAARAGEAGRGFAVVAGEVKTLANQTARATEEIAGQIAAIQQETGQAVAALRSIGGTIRRMNEIATAIAGAVEEQGAATQEIARGVQEAANGTAQVDNTIATVGGSVRRTGDQAGEVVQAARALTEQSATLAREVAEFLGALKAA